MHILLHSTSDSTAQVRPSLERFCFSRGPWARYFAQNLPRAPTSNERGMAGREEGHKFTVPIRPKYGKNSFLGSCWLRIKYVSSRNDYRFKAEVKYTLIGCLHCTLFSFFLQTKIMRHAKSSTLLKEETQGVQCAEITPINASPYTVAMPKTAALP